MLRMDGNKRLLSILLSSGLLFFTQHALGSECMSPELVSVTLNGSHNATTFSAVQKAVHYMRDFSIAPEHRVLNTISFFAEIAETSTDSQVAKEAKLWATKLIADYEQDILEKFKQGTFGELWGLRNDLLEALQLLTYKASLGLPVPKDARGLLMLTSRAFARCRTCVQTAEFTDPESAVDAILAAYVVDEASFRFGRHLFPIPKNLLRDAFEPGLSFFERAGTAELSSHRQPLRVRRLANANAYARYDSVSLGQQSKRGRHGIRLTRFQAKAYLATHLAFILGGFDRYHVNLENTIGEEVFSWLREAWPTILRMKDTELTGEVVAAIRSLSCSQDHDALLQEGSRQLLELQRADGAWGNLTRQQKIGEERGPQLQAYDVLHHVWTAVAALRPRRFLQDTYMEHLHLSLQKDRSQD